MLTRINWSPGIGDPTALGWFTVAFYFLTSMLAFATAYKYRHLKNDFRFWGILAVFLLLLGINKQLDLQSLLTAIGRLVAKEQGWYKERRPVQLAFIVILFTLALTSIVLLWWMLGQELRKFMFPITGFLLLVTFIIIRAASFHHVDRLLRSGPSGVGLKWIIELSGIGCLFLSSLFQVLHRTNDRKIRQR